MAFTGSSAFRDWINPKALETWQFFEDQMKQMDNPRVIHRAAMTAGQVLKTSMQDLIYSQPTLDSYADVAERITVWDETDNVWVGVPAGDPVEQRALDMNRIFPVVDTAVDLERQTHQTREVFETNLIGQVF